jgi:hypothetical protein
MSTASALGIDVSSLPIEDVQTLAGDIAIPIATIDASVFAGQPPSPFDFGVLSDSQNPFNENVLGGNILSGFNEVEFNVLFGRFEAVPAPEPSSLTLLLAGIAVLAISVSARKKKDVRSQRGA